MQINKNAGRQKKKEVIKMQENEKEIVEDALVSSKKQKKSKKGLLYAAGFAVSALLVAGVATSVGMNVMLMDVLSAQSAKVNQFIDDERARQAKEAEKENAYQEDGYVIMEQYEIRSTQHISDAYLKGDASALEGEDLETYELAKEVLAEIIKDGMSDYEKELAIYEWLVSNVNQGGGHFISRPGTGGQAFTPHGVLKSQQAVCVGYATTFRLLANMVGLDVHIVHNEYHSWDMVKLDDGEWYHVDAYSDATGAKYRNFNMTDEVARNGHEWDDSALPEAKGTKYSYAVQNAQPVQNLFELPEKIKTAMETKQEYMYFKFPHAIDEKEMALADQMMMLMQQAMYTLPEGGNMDLGAAWLSDGADGYVLAIYLTDYSQSQSTIGDADPAKVSEMTNKINTLFGIQLMNPADSGVITEPGGMDSSISTEDVPVTMEDVPVTMEPIKDEVIDITLQTTEK
ncbi:MAG: hypothetical protein J6B28_04635 [Eubacterium sp.]|nr:hypothetical protein [Eubacterium sp.]